jgi:hypothetical protein
LVVDGRGTRAPAHTRTQTRTDTHQVLHVLLLWALGIDLIEQMQLVPAHVTQTQTQTQAHTVWSVPLFHAPPSTKSGNTNTPQATHSLMRAEEPLRQHALAQQQLLRLKGAQSVLPSINHPPHRDPPLTSVDLTHAQISLTRGP